MSADHMATAVQLGDLTGSEKVRLVDEVRRNEEMAPPATLFECRSGKQVGAAAAVVKGNVGRRRSCCGCDDTRRLVAFCADGRKMRLEGCQAELVSVCGGPCEAARAHIVAGDD